MDLQRSFTGFLRPISKGHCHLRQVPFMNWREHMCNEKQQAQTTLHVSSSHENPNCLPISQHPPKVQPQRSSASEDTPLGGMGHDRPNTSSELLRDRSRPPQDHSPDLIRLPFTIVGCVHKTPPTGSDIWTEESGQSGRYRCVAA